MHQTDGYDEIPTIDDQFLLTRIGTPANTERTLAGLVYMKRDGPFSIPRGYTVSRRHRRLCRGELEERAV